MVADAVDEVLNRIEQQNVEPSLPENIMAKELLQMVYRGKVKVSPQQLRAAIENLPYESPKLSAVAHGYFEGNDFASQLERAIERSRQPTPLPAPTTEHDAQELKQPCVRYRRF